VAFFGYRVMGLRVLVFVIGAGIAGLAGGMFAAVEGFVSPTLIGFLLSTEVLIWTALGGREVLLAAFLGAIAVRWIESSLVDLLGDYWILALGLVFMASVVLLPKGLIATPLERLGRG
jgi:urea transport system permease protein